VTAKTVCGIIGLILGTSISPISLWRCFACLHAFWYGGDFFYLALISAVFWSIWITRNKVTFDEFILKSPVTIIFTVCSIFKYWAGLYQDEDKQAIHAGVDQPRKKAAELVGGNDSSNNGGPTCSFTVVLLDLYGQSFK
jgi:hypothetical protein